jgi:drug/metabolite transporter (DMT)-like permease
VTPPALALVVVAALLHACWNALAKGARDQTAFLWLSVSAASMAFLPVGLVRLPPGGVPRAALPFVAATILIHTVYFFALGRAYRDGDFSRVYPIARGLGVALVPVLALALLDERLSPLGTVGVALVVGGIVSVSLVTRRIPGAGRPGRGTAWAILTGVSIASYSLVDKEGVRHLDPVAYIALLGLGISALLAPVALRQRAAVARDWRVGWRWILLAASMNLTSYLLVLFAFRLSKVGYVVAARELSILFSAFIGSLWLGEGRLAPRLAGASVVLAGVVLVALAR